MRSIILILFLVHTLLATELEKPFNIDMVSIKVYDNHTNQIVDQPINEYGNNMNLFLAVKISQTTDSMNKYTLKIDGYGKGRDNDAEGFLENYKIAVSKSIILYNNDSIFVPFIIEYPYTDEETFTITLSNEKGRKVSKEIINKLTSCYLN